MRKKNIYTEKTFFNKTEKRSVLIFRGLSCKSTKNLYCAKCYKNAIKRIFGRKKEELERDVFFPPFAFLPYTNDQPNALDTAVRRCSYTLTLHVLNDSGRMNHVAEMDFFCISQHLLLHLLHVKDEFVQFLFHTTSVTVQLTESFIFFWAESLINVLRC